MYLLFCVCFANRRFHRRAVGIELGATDENRPAPCEMRPEGRSFNQGIGRWSVSSRTPSTIAWFLSSREGSYGYLPASTSSLYSQLHSALNWSFSSSSSMNAFHAVHNSFDTLRYE